MLNYINIELTNMCNKDCFFCGRKNHPPDDYGSMDINLFEKILDQLDSLEIIQFHKDGEPLLYDGLYTVGKLCQRKGVISNIVTNGKGLSKKVQDLSNFTTITVSVFEQDKEQYLEINRFRQLTNKPRIIIKLLGDYEGKEYKEMNLPIIRRQIHSPEGSFDYKKSPPIMPEIGICWDFFKPSVNWKGEMFICNRFDPEGLGFLGDLNKSTVAELWYSDKRLKWLEYHKLGRREQVPLCGKCQFWGVPNG